MSSRTRSKKTGHRHRSRAEKQRRGRLYGILVLGVPALALVFYLLDRSGPLETIQGTVVETSTYTHSGSDRQGEHTHVSAVLEYEGQRHKLQRGDLFRQGETISVEVRRGRFTGYPYFVQAWHARSGDDISG